MSGQGSGSGSDRLAKGKAVAYTPEGSPDTDDEYEAMENARTRADSVIARNLQAELDAKAAGIAVGVARPPPGPGITIGGNARSFGASRRFSGTLAGAPPTRPSSKRPRVARASPSAGPIPEDLVRPGVKYPPQGSICPRDTVFTPIYDTPLLTDLFAHPSTWVRRGEVCTHLCIILYLMSSLVVCVDIFLSYVLCRTLIPGCSAAVGG